MFPFQTKIEMQMKLAGFLLFFPCDICAHLQLPTLLSSARLKRSSNGLEHQMNAYLIVPVLTSNKTKPLSKPSSAVGNPSQAADPTQSVTAATAPSKSSAPTSTVVELTFEMNLQKLTGKIQHWRRHCCMFSNASCLPREVDKQSLPHINVDALKSIKLVGLRCGQVWALLLCYFLLWPAFLSWLLCLE